MKFFLVVPKTEGGVGEVWRAVEVSDSETASDVVHGGQRHVTSIHYPSLNGALTGAITKSHQTIVVVQTGGEKQLKCSNVSLTSTNQTNLPHNVHFIISQPIIIESFFPLPSIFCADLSHTTPHLENLDWLLMRDGLSGFRPPSRESVHTSHSLCPVAKFQ